MLDGITSSAGHAPTLTSDASPRWSSFGIAPSWSPDGATIVYPAAVGGKPQYELFSVSADGSGRTRLTNTPRRDDLYPLFSPDGAAIAFTRRGLNDSALFWDDYHERTDLFMMAADGSNVQRLTDTPRRFEFTRSWRALPSA